MQSLCLYPPLTLSPWTVCSWMFRFRFSTYETLWKTCFHQHSLGVEGGILLRYYFSISSGLPSSPLIYMFTECTTFCVIPNLVKLKRLLLISVSQCWRITCIILHPRLVHIKLESLPKMFFPFFQRRSEHFLCTPINDSNFELLSFFLPISVSLLISSLQPHIYLSDCMQMWRWNDVENEDDDGNLDRTGSSRPMALDPSIDFVFREIHDVWKSCTVTPLMFVWFQEDRAD